VANAGHLTLLALACIYGGSVLVRLDQRYDEQTSVSFRRWHARLGWCISHRIFGKISDRPTRCIQLLRGQTLSSLFHELKTQGDAHAIDKDDALIQKLLVRNVGVHESFESDSRADELDSFGFAFCIRRNLVQDREIK
jgi:hypothetical protein